MTTATVQQPTAWPVEHTTTASLADALERAAARLRAAGDRDIAAVQLEIDVQVLSPRGGGTAGDDDRVTAVDWLAHVFAQGLPVYIRDGLYLSPFDTRKCREVGAVVSVFGSMNPPARIVEFARLEAYDGAAAAGVEILRGDLPRRVPGAALVDNPVPLTVGALLDEAAAIPSDPALDESVPYIPVERDERPILGARGAGVVELDTDASFAIGRTAVAR